MSKTIFIGGLAWAIESGDLERIFSEHATVVSAKVIFDREENRSKGFGFVEFEDEDTASAMKEKFDWQEIQGRKVFIDFAREKAE